MNTKYNIEFDAAQLESNSPGEDRFRVVQKDGISAFAVLDGHGGYLAADIGVTTLLELIVENTHSLPSPRHPPDVCNVIDMSFALVDDIITQYVISVKQELAMGGQCNTPTRTSMRRLTDKQGGTGVKPLQYAGSCAVVLLVVESVFYVAHVGDCRAVLIEESVDHDFSPHSSPPTTLPRTHCGPFTRDIPGVPSTPMACNGHAGHYWDSKLSSIDFAQDNPCIVNGVGVSSTGQNSSNKRQTESSASSVDSNATVNIEITQMQTQTRAHSSHAEVDANSISVQPKSPLNLISAPIAGSNNNADTAVSADNVTEMPPSSKVTKGTGPTKKVRSRSAASLSSKRHKTYHLRGLTVDHCCADPGEAALVRRLTSDPQPIRAGSLGYLRVAGSLSVTRALGDCYLKSKELGETQYAPYISGRPVVSYRAIQPSDRAIVLASDGLWDFLRPERCLDILTAQLFKDSVLKAYLNSVASLPVPPTSTHIDQMNSNLELTHNANTHQFKHIKHSSTADLSAESFLRLSTNSATISNSATLLQRSIDESRFSPNAIACQSNVSPYLEFPVTQLNLSVTSHVMTASPSHASRNRGGSRAWLGSKDESQSSKSASSNSHKTEFINDLPSLFIDAGCDHLQSPTSSASNSTAVLNTPQHSRQSQDQIQHNLRQIINKRTQHQSSFIRNSELVEHEHGVHKGVLVYSSRTAHSLHSITAPKSHGQENAFPTADFSTAISPSTSLFGLEDSSSTLHPNLSLSLLDACVENAAEYSHCRPEELMRLQPGRKRRQLLDDVTVMVINFGCSQAPTIFNSETASLQDTR